MMETTKPEMLKASALGTKAYWDSIYEKELANHAEDPDDEGTIWFEDSGAEEKMLEYIEELPFGSAQVDNIDNEQLRVLDLGTGNGHLLFALKDAGWRAQMVGVDYSESSIKLAKQIQQARNALAAEDDSRDETDANIDFFTSDVLGNEVSTWGNKGFDIVLDKGTFDAISLSDARNETDNTGSEIYGDKVQRLIRPKGYLLVTSCNWTANELRRWLESPRLTYHGTIEYPSFTFGGVKGQTVSSVCFRRT